MIESVSNEEAAIKWADLQASIYGLCDQKRARLRQAATEIAARYRRESDHFKKNTLIRRSAQKLAAQNWSNVSVITSGQHEVIL